MGSRLMMIRRRDTGITIMLELCDTGGSSSGTFSMKAPMLKWLQKPAYTPTAHSTSGNLISMASAQRQHISAGRHTAACARSCRTDADVAALPGRVDDLVEDLGRVRLQHERHLHL